MSQAAIEQLSGELMVLNYSSVPNLRRLQSIALGLAYSRKLHMTTDPAETPAAAYEHAVGGELMTNIVHTQVLSVIINHIPGLEPAVISQACQAGWMIRYNACYPSRYTSVVQMSCLPTYLELLTDAQSVMAPGLTALLNCDPLVTSRLINVMTDLIQQVCALNAPESSLC